MSSNYLNTSIYNNPIISRAIAPLPNLQAQKTSSNLNNSLFDQNINTSNQVLTNPSISLDALIQLIQLLQKMKSNPATTQTDSQNTAKSVDPQMTTIKAAQILKDNMSLFDQAAGVGKKDQIIGYQDLKAIAKNNSPEFKQQKEAAQYILNNKNAYNSLGNKNGLIGTKDLQGYIQKQGSSNTNNDTPTTTTTTKPVTNTNNTTHATHTANTTNAKPATPVTPAPDTTPVTNTSKTTNTSNVTANVGQGKSLTGAALGKNVFDDANWQKELNVTSSWRMENTKIVKDDTGRFDNVLRQTYEAGEDNQGGSGLWTKIAPTDHAFLKYSVKFDEDFEFVKGGKLPGFFGGDGRNGGSQLAFGGGGPMPDGTNGFTTRYMWREGGKGEMYGYLPTSRQDGIDNGAYASELGKGSFNFKPGEWQDLEQELQMNTPGKKDGVIRIWSDDKLVYEKTDAIFRTTEKVKIDGLFYSTFYGGGGADWAPKNDTSADFANFQISDKFIP